MSSDGLRNRGPKANDPAPIATQTTTQQRLRKEDTSTISLLDILRIALTLALLSCALSYYLTPTSSLFWGYSAWFLNRHALAQYFRGPVHLTPTQLALYNGTDPSLPIYLAINGTIFDVSASPKTYGPGGSYSVFAGRDATRAFVTGCFLEDRTGDLRGAEEIYLPVEDVEDEQISSGERKTRAERERREARKRVQGEVSNWVGFYGKSEKYFEVGRVVGVEQYEEEEVPKLCEVAQKGRPRRSKMDKGKGKERGEAPGKPVQ